MCIIHQFQRPTRPPLRACSPGRTIIRHRILERLITSLTDTFTSWGLYILCFGSTAKHPKERLQGLVEGHRLLE